MVARREANVYHRRRETRKEPPEAKEEEEEEGKSKKRGKQGHGWREGPLAQPLWSAWRAVVDGHVGAG